MNVETLRDLLEHELKDLHSAERQIVEALPEMIAASCAPELASALQLHLTLTEGHVERLERVLRALGASPGRLKCRGMEGLLAEAKSILAAAGDDVVDAAIIGAAQKVEHYEMAGYGTVAAYAKRLGENDVAQLLESTLLEEKQADLALTGIAEATVNAEAMA
jgi:ferritin-like metal-binding protein YciE